jgi:type II secretion system protein G
MRIMRVKKTGFTLIELLIVVAIIAILAAIAVPNFLEAQTRSKVSRAKADMRSVATAIEAYRVDYNNYPLAASLDDPTISVLKDAIEPIEGVVPYSITSPVAYMTSLPRDPFPPRGDGEHAADETFHYLDLYTATQRGEPDVMGDYFLALTGQENGALSWWLFTIGPDLDHDEDLSGSEQEVAAALYDPTNGTVSSGDIFYFGPGIGFR